MVDSVRVFRKTSIVNIEGSDPCFNALVNQVRKRHGDDAAQSLHAKALEVVQEVANAYSNAFGAGGVGISGTHRASCGKRGLNAAIPEKTTGLIYGKIQSGKTDAATATVALARANGFRCFVVLTSDNVLLGRQTLTRFNKRLSNGGPRVYGWTEFKDPEAMGRDIKRNGEFEDTGVVFVCTKNKDHLPALLTVLRKSGAGDVPAILVDDEADHASLDTHASRGDRRDKNKASKIFESIGDLRRAMPCHIYLQLTATPQSLLLQAIDHPLRPVFCSLLQPGKDYVGGDTFFAPDSNYLVEVDAAEFDHLRSGHIRVGKESVPKGLRRAICTFLAGAAQKLIVNGDDEAKYTFLIHISQRKEDFKHLKEIVQGFLVDLDKALRGKIGENKRSVAEGWLDDGRNELKRTCPSVQPLPELLDALRVRLTNVKPVVIDSNSPHEIEYRDGINILIGGNRLSRGITIDGLMVTYYGRDPKTPIGDTIHQHARMYGYRRGLLDVARIYSAPHLLNAFRLIHESDEATRTAIGDDPQHLLVKPVWVGEGIRPTRSNVLNPAEIGAISSGITIYPADPIWRSSEIERNFRELDRLLERFVGDENYHQVELGFLIKLLRLMPSSSRFPGYTWEDRRVQEILVALGKAPFGVANARLNVRRGKYGRGLQLKRQEPPWQGFVSSPWEQRARRDFQNVPTLIVMMEEGRRDKGWDGRRVYLPTLVLPRSKFVFMFNFKTS